MLKEFKEFAFKGNLVDMAVGFILGGAFATVVKTFVAKVVMPPLGLLLGDVDFADMKYVLKAGVAEVKEGDKVVTPARINPTAISTRLPLKANSLNSFNMLYLVGLGWRGISGGYA